MSQEFDELTHAFAELLSKLQSANDDDKHAAITSLSILYSWRSEALSIDSMRWSKVTA